VLGVRRVELVVVGAVVLSTPSILQAFSGGIALTTALLRFAAALALCWAVGAIVERTLDTYARQARQKELAERIAKVRAKQSTALSPPSARPGQTPLSPLPPERSEARSFQ
jgi:hypothetical protein